MRIVEVQNEFVEWISKKNINITVDFDNKIEITHEVLAGLKYTKYNVLNMEYYEASRMRYRKQRYKRINAIDNVVR